MKTRRGVGGLEKFGLSSEHTLQSRTVWRTSSTEHGKIFARTVMQTCDTRVAQRGMDIMKCTPIHASAVNSGI